MAPQKYAERPAQPGLAGAAIALAVETLSWLAISLVLSIIVEWLGVAFWWKDQGAQRSLELLRAEIANLAFDPGSLLAKSSTAGAVADAADWVYRSAWEKTGAIAQFSALDGALREYAFATVNVVQIFVVRLAILGFSTPLFLLAGAVGLVDGLVERDLRRWGGGRESGYVFHIAARIIKPAVLWSWVIYLSSPVRIDPALAILPFAALFAFALRISAASFKKYL